MSGRQKIAWIDDNPQRERTANQLGADFINVHKADLALALENLLNGRPRPLVIIDHVLDKTSSTNPVFLRGSTLAEAIKEKWPSCPVLGVTNTDIGDIDLRVKESYDDVIAYSDFGQHFDRIKPLAADFAHVAAARPKNTKQLVALLKPPAEDANRIESALPEDMQRSVRDRSVSSLLYRWVNHLMLRIGFLYDDIWTATFCGLNEQGLQKVERTFRPAVYDGVFARDNDLRWWSSELPLLLYKQIKPLSGEMSWHVGRKLSGIQAKHYSKCHVCGRDYPEVVAFLDASTEERRPMHLECTVLHPKYKRELYFEDVRMMRGS